MTNLYGRLLGLVYQSDGTCRTYFGTFGTLGTAVALFRTTFRAASARQVGRWTEYLIRADGNAELTGCTVLTEVTDALCSRRNKGCLSFGHFLVSDGSQTAVYFLFLCIQRAAGYCQCRCRQEAAAATVYVFGVLGFCSGISASFYIVEGAFLAGIQTVQTYYATAVVYLVRYAVDAGCLTATGTQSATVALGGINFGTEPREAGKEAQYGTHRADGIAVGTSVPPCQYDNNKQKYD